MGALLGGSLITLFTLIYQTTGKNFWVYSWIVFSVLDMIFISMFYTSLLLPLFNKLKPLEDGDLKSEIAAYCQKTGLQDGQHHGDETFKAIRESECFF